jgi:speckle-type POZ protein
MIVPYEWILENVGEEPMTITSKMISFGGEKVFRVGLKNYDEYSILFFVEINLNKIGMEVEDLTYGIQGGGTTGPVTMEQMKKENIGGCENLHLFKMLIDQKIVRNWTFSFRIVIQELPNTIYYRLCARLAKDLIILPFHSSILFQI